MYHEAKNIFGIMVTLDRGTAAYPPYLVVTNDILVMKIIFVLVLVLVSFQINHFYFI